MTIRRKSILIFIISCVVTFVATFYSFAANNVEVHFIDVGQGDAVLIMCEGHNMIIDGGSSADSSKIYAYLKNQGVRSLDYMVNTHGDADHVGGMPGAIQLVGKNIGTVLAPYTDFDKERFRVFKRKLEESNKVIEVPKIGTQYKLGGASFQVLAGGGSGDNHSIVLRLKYGDTSFLFMGDADENQEKSIMNSGYEIESDVLKVGHHGSKNATSYQFLRAVYPRAAVISVGKGNSYGHPTDEVLSKLRDEGANVFRTDNNGTIIFYSDGKDIRYSTEKEYSQEKNLIPGGYFSSNSKAIKETQIQTRSAVSSVNGNVQSYVLNTNSKKFHYPNCSSVNKMKAKNREDVVDTRENIIARGFVPCKNCNP